jgi:hypothetical protein
MCGVLFLLLAGCGLAIKQGATRENMQASEDDDYFISEISIDSLCVEKTKSSLIEKYGYKPNFYKCMKTKKFEKAVFFAVNEVAESGFAVLNEGGVMVSLTEQCEIDTLVWPSGKNQKK